MSVSFRSRTTTGEDGTVVVHLEGELDLIASPEFRALLAEVTTHASGLVVDLADVRFVDSTGLALLLQAHKRMENRSLPFSVINATGQPLSLLQISGLHGFLRGRPAVAVD
jgi:anti-anti-sigma factor